MSYQSTDVCDAARNLAGKGSTYGVRLELPNHHKSAMKAPQSASYELKTKFPQARQNVLFDDETLDLVLDFCLEEGGTWKRMTSDQALRRRKRRPIEGKTRLEEGELESLLDSDQSDKESQQYARQDRGNLENLGDADDSSLDGDSSMGWQLDGCGDALFEDEPISGDAPTIDENVQPEIEEKNKELVTPLNIINTNARSLCPKIDSLIDCFEELDVTH